MSSAIKRKKRKMKPKNYELKPVVLGQVKDQAMLQRCFHKVFTSLQLCSWYVLYAPEFFDWDYEKCKEFSDKMDRHNLEFGIGEDEYKVIREELSGKIGIDIFEESKKFPYRVKVKMYGEKIHQRNIENIVFAMNLAIESVLFLALYTLFYDFDIPACEIKDVFTPQLMTIAWEYASGMSDKHLIEYFSNLEGWKIYDVNGEEMMA